MKVVKRGLLLAFCDKHADARNWIKAWLAEVEASEWVVPADIKTRYSSASFLSNPNNTVIFNVKGNDYRLEIIVAYRTKAVIIKWVGTHAEYDKRNKQR